MAPWFAVDNDWDTDLRSGDPLGFPHYNPELTRCDAAQTGTVTVQGQPVVVITMDFAYFGGTMGIVAGEKIVRAFDRATEMRVPVVVLTRTGGVRLQEGTLALLQMGRATASRARHAAAGLLMVSVFDSPTTGGVYASWASLADVKAARRGAVMGFGGPRVVEHVTGQAPTTISHSAEAAYAHGLVDALLEEVEVVPWAETALGVGRQPLRIPPRSYVKCPADDHPAALQLTGWQAVQRARQRSRASGVEWAAALSTSWTELRGTDPTMRAGIATLVSGHRAMIVATDRHARADGAARPGAGAYRLVRRASNTASRLGLPILTIIDLPGAEPGPEQENDGLASEIASALEAISSAASATVSLCVGEGGSGGAMALAYTDRRLMLEDAVFPVISPEVAGLVLFKDPGRAEEIASRLQLTASELLQLGVADEVVGGPGVLTSTREAVGRALQEAVPGDRHQRADDATHRWLSMPATSSV